MPSRRSKHWDRKRWDVSELEAIQCEPVLRALNPRLSQLQRRYIVFLATWSHEMLRRNSKRRERERERGRGEERDVAIRLQSFESVRAISKQNNTSSPLDRTLGIHTNDRAFRRSAETNVPIAIHRKVDATLSMVPSHQPLNKATVDTKKRQHCRRVALPSAQERKTSIRRRSWEVFLINLREFLKPFLFTLLRKVKTRNDSSFLECLLKKQHVVKNKKERTHKKILDKKFYNFLIKV